MTELKGEQTASEIIKGAADTASHIDAKGRRITVKRLSALQIYRMAKLPGAPTNPAAQDLATLACSVVKIDADPVSFPSTEREVEFLIQQLDFDGIAAAGEALRKLNETRDATSEADIAKN